MLDFFAFSTKPTLWHLSKQTKKMHETRLCLFDLEHISNFSYVLIYFMTAYDAVIFLLSWQSVFSFTSLFHLAIHKLHSISYLYHFQAFHHSEIFPTQLHILDLAIYYLQVFLVVNFVVVNF